MKNIVFNFMSWNERTLAPAGGFGAQLGTFGQSIGYNVLSNVVSNSATTLAFGGDITAGGFVGMVAGGCIGAGIGNFSGVSGSALKNIGAEMAFGIGKGAVTGGFGGAIGAAIDGKDMGQGFIQGAKYGAIAGGVSSAMMITMFGSAIKPTEKAQRTIDEYKKLSGLASIKSPVFRRGGLYKIFTNRGVTWGRNLVVPDGDDDTYTHEYIHYLQQFRQGFGMMQAKGIYEQFRYTLSRGKWNPYEVKKTNEFDAQYPYENFFRR